MATYQIKSNYSKAFFIHDMDFSIRHQATAAYQVRLGKLQTFWAANPQIREEFRKRYLLERKAETLSFIVHANFRKMMELAAR